MRRFAGLQTPKLVAPLQEGIFILNLPDNNLSSAAARLQDARLKQWHQQGEALLTIENARSFLNATGLVLFAPRPQIAAPAPSFVEAVLGAPNPTPTLAETTQARELLARLIAEGLAVPLNLLGIGSVIGQAGDAPDFIVSAQIFSYVFTLRGDKAWKQPPQAAGPTKVSHLAIATYEALAKRGSLSSYDLATELGKEVTEGAVLRALGELWMHLRVLPMLQVDGRATLWELAGTRLTKQIKAGANAGLPTALSTLISLYLGQAIVAGEDEIESFLSPLAARSRVRDVLHALLSARELDTVAIEGKTVLHVAGDVPAFLTEEAPVEVAASLAEPEIAITHAATEEQPDAAEPTADESSTASGDAADSAPRIAKFVPRRKPATKDLAKAKPARKPLGEARKPFGEKRSFTPRDPRARPPFRDGKSARPSGGARGFKPAEGSAGEGRPRFVRPERLDGKPDRERRPFVKREGSDSRPARKPFDRGDRPAPRKPFSRSAEDRPARKPFDRSTDSRAPRKPFSRSAEDRPPRKSFDRTSDSRPPRKPFDRSSDSRPPRKSFDRTSDSRPPRKPFSRSAEDRPPRKPFDRSSDSRPPRKPFDRSSDSRPPRKPFDRGGDRPTTRKPFGSTARFAPRGESSSRDREFKPKPFGKPKPFARRTESGDRAEGRTSSGPGGFAGKKPFSRPSGKSFGSKPFAGRPRGEGPGRSSGGAGKKFGGKSFGGAKRPFGKPSPGRGPKPRRSDPQA